MLSKNIKIEVQKGKIQGLNDGIKTSQKLLDEVQAYSSVIILDADDLETICQCKLSIKDFQRQKHTLLVVMIPQKSAVIDNGVPEEVAPEELVEERAPSLTKREKDQHKKNPVQAKRHLDEPNVKSIPLTFFKPSNMVWAVLSLTTSKAKTYCVVLEMTADAQADSSVNFKILLDGTTGPGQTVMPKPDSLEIGIHKITCWFKDMQQVGVFFTNAIAIVNQKMPEVRYLAPFTVSLLTERTGDRRS